jgi:hypothetical protein
MKKSIQISIPTPCHENWDTMTPDNKGRFCASCQKTVFDFTKSSDREIASILKNTNNACGRFRTTQLDRELVVPKEKSSLWIAASAAVVSFLTLGTQDVFAQTPVNTEQRVSETDEIIGKVALPQKRMITGTVLDQEGLPIPGANVDIEGSEKGVKSDFEGTFSINVSEGDTLIVKFYPLLTQKIIITNERTYKIIMQDDCSLYENIEYDIYGGISVHRTFFGRVFHFIGNIFR